LSAALTTFEARPDAVLSIAHTEAVRHELAGMLKRAARLRIAYREVDAETLARMAQSVHHEGVCLLVRPKPALDLGDLTRTTRERGLVLALDGVENPHNVGAILRSAAYFGVRAVVYASEAHESSLVPQLSAAARRVAEGGAELVEVSRVERLAPVLKQLKAAGMSIIGSDAHAKEALPSLRWPARSVIVLGHEQHGMSREVRAQCQKLVGIPGSERIDSLNVSVAAGIFLASYAAKHGVWKHGGGE
jgi:TrmH RNA methyltransferase